MRSRKIASLAAVVTGSAVLAAGSAVAFAAANTDHSASRDEQITQQVKQRLSKNISGGLIGVEVETKDGVVTLSGRAATGLAEVKALQEARQVPGVTDVKDQLKVQM